MHTNLRMTTDGLPRRIAAIAFTAASLQHCKRLQQSLGTEMSIYAHTRALTGASDHQIDMISFTAIKPLLRQLWSEMDGLVLCLALGAVVRLIAPLQRDKRSDPSVVVIDDAATFAISLLSSHLGGGNILARRCAETLDAIPVITTASDVLSTIAVDMLGREYGWQIDPDAAITEVAAAVVNGDPIAIVQETGEQTWWPHERPLPANIISLSRLDEVDAGTFGGLLLITDRIADQLPSRLPCVTYHPRTLVVGMGCRRGVTVAVLEELLTKTLNTYRLSPQSIAAIASADIKANEPALITLAAQLGVPLRTFAAETLAAWTTPTPSPRVAALVGTPSVSEAAALAASSNGDLIVAKQKGVGCTIAIAR